MSIFRNNNKVKRVLLVSFEYPVGKAYCGGVGQIVKLCHDILKTSGYEVYVLITSHFHKKYPVKLLLPDDRLVNYKDFYSFQKDYKWNCFNYIIQHFVNWPQEFKRLKKQKGPRPYILYHFHSILRRERDSGFKTFNRFMINQEKMIELSDKIICPSKYEYENFTRYFPAFIDKVKLIENTIEVFPRDDKEVEKIKKIHSIKETDIVSIFVGRLERIKGAHILIANLPTILKRYRNLKVFIVGKSLERDIYKKLMRLKKKFKNQVFYKRYLNKDRLFQYYYSSDVYINSSLSESFSLSSYENAYCNNALLLNKLPVFDNFKDSALFFSNHDSNGDGFLSKFDYLLKNKRLRNKLSKNSKKALKKIISKSRIAEEFNKLLR
ncbi:MAG: glycosyltransferase family 4 protein [Candidatus Gygaella obscura]|nr:glycosyltransferase family 4 protein [Candidatus Gygaella obscura]